MTSKPDRKARHKALLRDVAKLINQPADSLAVRLVALARLRMDVVEAQLLSGDSSVTVADITALQEIFAAHVPKPKMQINVRFVEPADAAEAGSGAIDGVAVCRRCSWTPAGNDRWPECPACGWRCGHDIAGPHTPLIAGIPAPASKADSLSSPQSSPATATAPGNVIPMNAEQRAEQAVERRAAARISNNIDPGPPRTASPCIGSPFVGGGGDSRSISQFQRDVDAAYK
jgi:hypothetical protein